MTEKEKGINHEIEVAKKSGANLLLPSTHIEGLSEFHAPVLERVLLSANPDDGDVYPHDTDGKKYRPTKQALMKLSVCAGVIWSPTECRRVDNGADRNYIAYRAVGGIRKADGQPVFFSAEYDLDFEVMEEELRDNYEKKANKMIGKSAKERAEYVDYCVKRDLLQKRKHRLKLCEAGAMNRVLRMLLGIKQAYTVEELSKPFVTARIVFRPDFTDKAVRDKFIDASIKAMTGIYGTDAAARLPEKTEPIDVTPCPPEDMEAAIALPSPDPAAPSAPNYQWLDFENSAPDDQIRTLTSLAKKKGYDMAAYIAKSKKPLAELRPEKRLEFFKHLLSLPDDDEVPF